MGMSTRVVGIKPPDEMRKKMKAIWDACNSAGIDIPKEVNAYFDYDNPDEKGIIVDIKAEEYEEDMRNGYEVDLTQLDKDIKILRFYNSY